MSRLYGRVGKAEERKLKRRVEQVEGVDFIYF
jgi:hypothetical protein